jgi:5,10-methylenetetrahydromethanopterin reductase
MKIVEYTRKAEEGGFDYVWITDHYNNRNCYVVLTHVALNTKRIRLGPGVTNPYVVNPAWTASALASLDELSGGRAVLGLGAGDKVTLEMLGIPFKRPLSAIRESVDAIRRLWQGEGIEHSGRVFDFSGARLSHRPSARIPIYVGAQGPKMLKLAGRIGDGVLINASHPKDFELALKGIRSGADDGNRQMSEIDVVAYASFSVAHDTAKAKKKVAPVVAFIAAGSPPPVLERHGIPDEDVAKISNALAKGNFGAAFGAVTDPMIDAFSIYGSPDDCVERIATLTKIGVSQLVVGSPIGPKKKNAIDLIAREIIPSL